MSWILGEHDDLDEKLFKPRFRKALLKGIADAVLVRTHATGYQVGINGRFVLGPAKPKNAGKPKAPATKKTTKAPATMPEAGDDTAAPSGAAALKPAARQKAAKKAKPPVSQDAEEAGDDEASKPKAAKSRKQPADDKADDVDPTVKVKARVGRKKAPPADREPAAQPEAEPTVSRNEPKRAAAPKARRQPAGARKTAQ